jgi:hypothetical protein
MHFLHAPKGQKVWQKYPLYFNTLNSEKGAFDLLSGNTPRVILGVVVRVRVYTGWGDKSAKSAKRLANRINFLLRNY